MTSGVVDLAIKTNNRLPIAEVKQGPIQQLFEAQVACTPDAVAAIYDLRLTIDEERGTQVNGSASQVSREEPSSYAHQSLVNPKSKIPNPLTYRELNERANQLAHYLQSVGVGPEVLVGLCVERSLDMIVGLLAILKAGGAYVPLDPSYPRERLAFMLQDANVAVLVTQQQWLEHLPPTRAPMICLDREESQIAKQPSANPANQGQADNLAYVIYTSGSTGQPKGVMIEHGGIRNLAHAQSQLFGVQPGDRVLQFASLNFDASLWEIVMTLCAGATLYVAPTSALLPGPPLTHFLVTHRITHVTLVPSALSALAPDELPLLQTVIVAGEACPPALAQRWQRGRRFFNAYGPTEATVCATIMACTDDMAFSLTPPIGQPLANVQVYILDEHLQPVSAGEAGELYIGGAGLARGYLNRPELTNEKFINNPFGVGRLYKTGDLARWLPDSAGVANIEFLGRIDHQVKLRGFRIELGEIETALLQHPAVQAAVVVARGDQAGEQRLDVNSPTRLVAYVVTAGQREEQDEASVVSAVDLRNFLARYLPDYMLPAAFVRLAAFPLTLNGKVDRKALPAPDSATMLTNGFAPPQTATEILLAGIWTEVLGLPQVGRADNFFEIGGHSLLAIQVIARVRAAFAVEVDVRALFAAPILAALGQLIDERRHAGEFAPPPPMAIGERPSNLPLSYAQQRLWFLDQFEGASATYNVPFPVRFSGTLNVVALHTALNAIVQRHEVLRTTFPVVDGVAQQVIAPNLVLALPVIDLRVGLPESGASTSELQAELQRQLQAAAWQPFDLVAGPLLRATLYRLSETDHVLLLNCHHIITDGWSLGVLLRELTAFYQAHQAGVAAALPPLPIQYADFTLWQRDWLECADLAHQRAYWRQQLADAPDLLRLPTDFPRPPVQTFAGSMLEFRLDPALIAALQHLSQQQGVSLFMTFYAVFAVLLARSSGQEDLVIGTPVANRQQHEVESLIGFFVNTLPLRVDLRGNPTFAALLARVRRLTLDAYAHQDIPFEQLVSDLSVSRNPSHSPLFQVMLTFDNTPAVLPQLTDLTVTPVGLENVVAKFDLTLQLTERAGMLQAGLEYNSDLFARATIERMVGHFQTLLRAFVADPATRIQQAPLLSAAERHQLLVEWNNTATTYPKHKTISQLFEEQVARTPDAVAVVLADLGSEIFDPELDNVIQNPKSKIQNFLTYRELNERANQLAHYLQAQGVGPETLVGLCIERSLEMIVGILGILKAGGAYVPLDPTYPPERLAFMLEDTGTPLILTQAKRRSVVPNGRDTLCLDTEWAKVINQPTDNLPHKADPENLAYVMYTSGSTGQPKGVSVIQRNVVRLVQNTNFAQLTADEVFLQLAPISFDAATLEVWGALLNGGCLVVMPPGQPALQEIGAAIRQYGVTTLWLTAGLFHLLVDERLDDLRPLRQLLAGGDVLSVPHVQRVLQALPHCRLINGYGPTENTTFTCCYPFTAAAAIGNSAPIGRPIANTQVYILDAQMQPVPIGVFGELYAGGDGVARGYLNRPALTDEKFVSNPFGAGRLYKTGDLARWLLSPAGIPHIEFLGRLDQQVKIRGFRIELGEIEASLNQHPAVREAIVVARQAATVKQLIAYLVAREPIQSSTLRRYLAAKLPDYMIPAVFVVLDTFPLTPNGKVDRKALPDPAASALVITTDVALPQTPTEEVLAAIWTEVLGLQHLGRHDNFFEIGGHSLLATQVVSRLRMAFALEIPVRTLFEASTIAELGQVIDQRRPAQEVTLPPPITAAERTGLLPLSYAQQRLWFLAQLEGPSATYNIPFALRFTGALNVAALHAALNAIVQRHEVLRTTFPASDGVAQQAIAPTLDLALPVIDLPLASTSAAEQQAALQQPLHTTAWQPFDLATGPLIRTTLYRMSESDHVLLLNLHHIVADGWSLGVLRQELALLYRAYASGELPLLAPLAVQYVDFALWQRQWLQGQVLERQRTYWQRQLAGAPVLVTLPTDFPRPPVQTFAGGLVEFTLDAALTKALHQLSQQQGASLFMTLYAAFAVLLARLSGQEDLVIGTPIANRQQKALESLIGFFVNILPLRADLRDNPSFTTLLARVRQLTLDAYAHQDIPFEQLVSELAVERSLSHTPLFQVMLTLDNTPPINPQMADLTVTPVALTSVVAKFDLTLHLTQHAETLRAGLEYNSDLFTRATIERMIGHWHTLLTSIVADPAMTIQQLPLLTAAERHQMLTEWNNTATAYPQDKTIQQLFEEQVARTPDAVAAIYDLRLTIDEERGTQVDGSARQVAREEPSSYAHQSLVNPKSKIQNPLTYRELNARANQLAHYLQSLGVGPGTFIGLCVERSLEMMVGIWGILKAGGAYVPLDPAYPPERLAFVLEDTGMQLVLTQQHLLAQFADFTPVQLTCLDADWPQIACMGAENPRSELKPTDLAYIIYTSGSTGRPKGVMVNHQNLVYSTTARFHYYPTAVERFLLLSSLAFDSSVAGIFWTLCQGGTLILPPQDAEKELDTIARLICDYKITHLLALPSLYSLLLTYTAPAQLCSLRVAIVAGEACPITLPSQHTACLPNATLYNEYGPTEGTVWSTVYQLPAHWQGTQVPIGRPIADMQTMIFDSYLQPVPIGVPGELYISGAGITPGYLNRPELTRERFIDFGFEILDFGLADSVDSANPKSKIQNPKWYKTGDLARYLPDGNIEFLGRIDQQVKIRGFRIELGEIETVLVQHPAVQEAVVVARADQPGETRLDVSSPTRLVAYVVTRGREDRETRRQGDRETGGGEESQLVAAADLRSFLQQRLPAYMLPAAFVLLDQLPLTPNGKVDRKALPEPGLAEGSLSTTYVAPRNTFEIMLADIWQALLNGPPVSVQDNFFALGGHSLLMAQLAAQIRTTFQVSIALRTLFQSPTLEAMSVALLEEMLKQTDGDTLNAILPVL